LNNDAEACSAAEKGSATEGEPENPWARGITGREILKSFGLGLLLVALSDIPNSLGPLHLAAQVLLGALLITATFLPAGKGLPLLLMLALAGPDIVGSGDYGSDASYSTASIWQINLGPIRPSWIIFLCVSIQLVRLRKLAIPPIAWLAIIWFVTVPFITGLAYGGFFSEAANTEEVVKDLKFGFMLVASLILFLTGIRKTPSLLTRLVCVFTGGLLARHSVDMVYYFLNWGPKIAEGVSRASEDTAKGGVIFLIYLGMALILINGRVLLGSGMSVLSIVLLAVYGTRLLMITFAQGLLVLPFFMGVRRSISLLAMLITLTAIGLWMFSIVTPKTAEVIFARSATIAVGRELHKWSVEVPYNVVSRIDPIRYGEGMNIFRAMDERFSYLWGMGYGGFYEDNAVTFPPDLSSSYPDYSLNSGIFYQAHLFSLHVFLKHGLIGLIIICCLWWVPGIQLFQRLLLERRLAPSSSGVAMLQGLALCFVAFMPTAIAQLYWSGKGLFLNGAILASCIELARRSDAGKLSAPSIPWKVG
jgi:hypothetical protein